MSARLRGPVDPGYMDAGQSLICCCCSSVWPKAGRDRGNEKSSNCWLGCSASLCASAIFFRAKIYIKIALHLTSTLLNEAHESGRHVVWALRFSGSRLCFCKPTPPNWVALWVCCWVGWALRVPVIHVRAWASGFKCSAWRRPTKIKLKSTHTPKGTREPKTVCVFQKSEIANGRHGTIYFCAGNLSIQHVCVRICGRFKKAVAKIGFPC